ncbi:MAG: twin-arginine translocase subunit TatC [Thermoanaerobaculia bacterium]
MTQLPRLGSENEELDRMSLLGHLEELRRRLVRSLVAFVASFLACWVFHEQIAAFLLLPLERMPPEIWAEGKRLIFLGPTDAFIFYLKVAALAAVFLASPWILYQLWGFVAPGLYRREKRMAVPFIFFGSSLFLAGGAFAYYIAFPFAVTFLIGFGGDQFEAQITIERYLSFLMTVILGLGVMFELPTLILLLSRAGIVTPVFLLRHFRWAVLLIFIFAAIITPTPDAVNLLIFALPTIVLYLVGIGVAAVFRPQPAAEEPADTAEAKVDNS